MDPGRFKCTVFGVEGNPGSGTSVRVSLWVTGTDERGSWGWGDEGPTLPALVEVEVSSTPRTFPIKDLLGDTDVRNHLSGHVPTLTSVPVPFLQRP